MKKKWLLTVVMLIPALAVFSQQKEYRNQFSFTNGPSYGIGAFGKVKALDVNTGAAGLGGSLQLSFSHRLNKTLSLMASLYGQVNGQRTSAQEAAYAAMAYQFGANDVRHYHRFTFEKGSWLNTTLLLGANAVVPLHKGSPVSFAFKAMVGPVRTWMPRVSGKTVSDTAYGEVEEPAKALWGVAYQLGAGVDIHPCNRLHVLAGLDYFGTGKLNFKSTTQTALFTNGGYIVLPMLSASKNNLVSAQSWSDHTKIAVSSVGLQLGLGFDF